MSSRGPYRRTKVPLVSQIRRSNKYAPMTKNLSRCWTNVSKNYSTKLIAILLVALREASAGTSQLRWLAYLPLKNTAPLIVNSSHFKNARQCEQKERADTSSPLQTGRQEQKPQVVLLKHPKYILKPEKVCVADDVICLRPLDLKNKFKLIHPTLSI